PQSINSIPQDAKNRGFKVLEIDQSGSTLRFLIQKP
ncbi:SirA-like protein, partial [Campylobacter sp. CH185]